MANPKPGITRFPPKTIVVQGTENNGRTNLKSLSDHLKQLGANIVEVPHWKDTKTCMDETQALLLRRPVGMILVWGPNLDRAVQIKKTLGLKTVIIGVEFGWLPQREWLLTDSQGMWNNASTRNLKAQELSKTAKQVVEIIKSWYRKESLTANWDESEMGLPEKYIFVPMQLARDKSVRRAYTPAMKAVSEEYKTIPMPYRYHIAMLTLIARNTTLPIVCRIHPLDKNEEFFKRELFIDALTKAGLIGRVTLCWETSSMALMKEATAVIGFTTTMLIEALCLGKATSGLGEGFISGSDGLFDSRDPEALKAWSMEPRNADSLIWEVFRRQIQASPKRQFPWRVNPVMDELLKAADLHPEKASVEYKLGCCEACPFSTVNGTKKFGLIGAVGTAIGKAVKAATGNEPLRCGLCGCFSAVKARTEHFHCPMGAW
jgi:hypothetical protein